MIKEAKFTFPSPYRNNISGNAIDLVKRSLVRDCDERLTAWQVLNHPKPFTKEIDGDKKFDPKYFKPLVHWSSSMQFIEHRLQNTTIK